jgi:alanyl-tRNA synthetase
MPRFLKVILPKTWKETMIRLIFGLYICLPVKSLTEVKRQFLGIGRQRSVRSMFRNTRRYQGRCRTRHDSGRELVNKGHPQVIEIWNLVFIQFNRKASGILENLPSRHVDTGMGFERLCMVMQGKKSTYDTDIFREIINTTSLLCGVIYGQNEKCDVAMRVIADHLRAVSFAIADGQIPSNNKAGYVIRRILRRAVRYGYTFLGLRDPFLCRLVGVLAEKWGMLFLS